MAGLRMLKPSSAVDMSVFMICGCQCSSLMSFWPMCTNMSCGGTSSSAGAAASSAAAACSSVSASSDRSQIVSELSALATASVLSSNGDHSIDVIGFVW